MVVAEIVQCDQLVAESTFALPVYAWQEQSQVLMKWLGGVCGV